MSTRKTLSRIILAESLFTAGLIPASAHAVVATQSASGKTDMTVTMPEYIVLRYYDNISLTFTGASGATSKGNKSFEATWTGSDATLDANVALPDELGAITRNIKLQNAWAIAGLSPSGTASVKITGTNLTKKDDKGTEISVIEVTNWTVSDGKNNADEITTTLRGVAGAVNKGDVNMVLNFANTTMSGDHSGTFTITVQTI
jgi:methionine-rich copper-binding protein CopC